MIVARFWSKHKETVVYEQQGKPRQLTIERWGFSNESIAHAQEVAKRRVFEAKEEFESKRHQRPKTFWSQWKREPKVPYNGAEGVPIREEILEERDETGVLTRNSYGAHCLNTQHMFIADIDKEGMSFRNEHLTSFLLIVSILTTFTVLLFSRMDLWVSLGGALLIGFPVALGLKFLAWHMYVFFSGGLKEVLKDRLTEHPSLSFRVYETPNGFRVIETSKPFVAASSFTQDLFKNLQTDPLYSKMCVQQKCFRARVSGKPWRMDMEKMPKAAWPIDSADKLHARNQWIKEYEVRAKDFASCRLLYTVGKDEQTPSTVFNTLQWHDQLCLNENNPLA